MGKHTPKVARYALLARSPTRGPLSPEEKLENGQSRLNDSAAINVQRDFVTCAMEKTVHALAPAPSIAQEIVRRNPKIGPQWSPHKWSKLKLCLGKGKTFKNIGKWWRICTSPEHEGWECRTPDFITEELEEPGYTKLLGFRAMYDSLGRKYSRQRVDPEFEEFEKTYINPLTTPFLEMMFEEVPPHFVAGVATFQDPGPPNTILGKRNRNASPSSSSTPKKRRQTPSVSDMEAALLYESSDGESFPSPVRAFVRPAKSRINVPSKVNASTSDAGPSVQPSEVFEIPSDYELDLEEISKTEFKRNIARNAQKRRIRKGKGRQM
ncbi:hypothetical protein BDN70DRAFT_939040 [Pholiota conissans]|uniref:Uncharacterized protein n=1 Tax=Pholiota conissans TaxID=109636 RepID=A0A9P5YMH0_9AGAR|nr:hypothetical protein BDN70DRAFT_939040 [Pholiota conissans]